MRPIRNISICVVAFTTLMFIGACKDDEPPTEVVWQDLRVRLTHKPARLEILTADGEVILRGLRGGKVREGDDPHVGMAFRAAVAYYEMLYGSFYIEETSAEPWRPASRISQVAETALSLSFDLLDEKGLPVAKGSVEYAGPGELSLEFKAVAESDNRVSFAYECHPGEHFIGMGGQSFDVDHRGLTVPIWVQEDGITKADTNDYGADLWFLQGRRNSTHTPMPIFYSSRGYALLLDTPYRSLFSFCSEDDGVVRIEAWENTMRLRFFYGPSLSESIRKVTAFVGRPEMPPPFTFAPWLDALYGSDNVRRVAEKLREEGVPSSVIWTEDWRGGAFDAYGYTLEEDWRVDRELYPDFELLAQDLHDLGFKFLVYNNTFIHEGVDVWDEADSAGYTIQNEAGKTYLFSSHKFGKSSLLDLTNPEAWEWAKEVYREGLLLGADGFMADFAEWLPVDAVLYSGEDAEAYHNIYPVEYQRLNKELFDEMYAEDGVERLFFVRSAYLYSQPLVSVVWAGDQQTDFSIDDGMPSVIPMGIGLGVTGFPFYGHDIAGYMSFMTQPATKELWFRWTTLGALSPVMRTHHGKSADENWNLESDQESIEHFKVWATLHIRLFPYLYGLARIAVDEGIPMMRPLALHYPDYEESWTLTDQYMLGDRILVAPVVEEGATARKVFFPEGTFYPLLGGDPVESPREGSYVTVNAGITECPAFVPAGSILVFLPEDIDTLVDADPNEDIMTLDDMKDDRVIHVFPRGESTWTEASGLQYDWKAESLHTLPSSASWNGETVAIEGNTVTLQGNGELQLSSDASLTIEGGKSDRIIQVVFMH